MVSFKPTPPNQTARPHTVYEQSVTYQDRALATTTPCALKLLLNTLRLFFQYQDVRKNCNPHVHLLSNQPHSEGHAGSIKTPYHLGHQTSGQQTQGWRGSCWFEMLKLLRTKQTMTGGFISTTSGSVKVTALNMPKQPQNVLYNPESTNLKPFYRNNLQC